MDGTFYDAPNDYRNYLAHHGVKGMHWGIRKQYPIVGRSSGELKAMSRNPLIRELQSANLRRNQAKYHKESKDFDLKNKDLVSKRDKLRQQHYDYISNKWNSYGKDKKFTSAINKWIESGVKNFEKRTGKSGAELRKYRMDSLSKRYGDDRDQSGFEEISEYLTTYDSDFRKLNEQLRATEREYSEKRRSHGRMSPQNVIY